MANKKTKTEVGDPEVEEVLCKIIDAEYKQYLGTEEQPVFQDSIYLTLKDLENKRILQTSLSSAAVKELTGLSREMSSKEMIYFADLLRSREEPIRLLVPVGEQNISTDIIKSSEQLDEKDEPIELSEGLAEATVNKGSGTTKFSIKNKKTKGK
jgi:hypothetical protein